MINPDPSAPAASPGVAPSNPAISMVPPLSIEEQLARSVAECDQLKRTLSNRETELSTLGQRLKDIEKNALNCTLINLDAGSVLEEMGKELEGLCATIIRRQEKGTFTLKLAIKPMNGTALVFQPEIKISEPKEDTPKSIFYQDTDGTLTRRDPRQGEFGFSRGDRSPTSEDDCYAEERRNPNLR